MEFDFAEVLLEVVARFARALERVTAAAGAMHAG